MVRNIVFGDTGGWLPQLLRSFDELGINAEESTMPKDMRVVHLGDLIHKGPFSSRLLAIVTGLMVNNPGQWVQLMGNHEAQHLPGAPVFWPCACDATDIGLMNELHRAELMLPTFGLTAASALSVDAANLEVAQTNAFFSHGGLTRGFWDWAAGADHDAVEVSRKLNAMPIHEITVPGLMLGENRPTSRIGPVWAIGNSEVFRSWREIPHQAMPFTQFHGHTTSYSYDHRQWWPGLDEFRKTVTLVPSSRAVVSELNNNLMLGLDPGFSEAPPRISAQPWFEFHTES